MNDWANRPVYAAVGVAVDGHKDVLELQVDSSRWETITVLHARKQHEHHQRKR
jgi:transposase-like protein